ncbi:hypothetical protein B0H19DRAFT_1083406 [Mycena capillaripes]|nr:hypothetical protein B0H19DRAFT_1083406 [Mycena capillaripes]
MSSNYREIIDNFARCCQFKSGQNNSTKFISNNLGRFFLMLGAGGVRVVWQIRGGLRLRSRWRAIFALRRVQDPDGARGCVCAGELVQSGVYARRGSMYTGVGRKGFILCSSGTVWKRTSDDRRGGMVDWGSWHAEDIHSRCDGADLQEMQAVVGHERGCPPTAAMPVGGLRDSLDPDALEAEHAANPPAATKRKSKKKGEDGDEENELAVYRLGAMALALHFRLRSIRTSGDSIILRPNPCLFSNIAVGTSSA